MIKDLERKYDLLKEEEKKLILIYKSRLSYFINNLDNINDTNIQEYKRKYEEYKNIVLSPQNLFVRNTIFKDIDFDDFATFLNSINLISNRINLLKNKIILDEDIVVYRATTLKNQKDISKISPANFISTSLDLSVTDDFYTYDGIDVLYQIKLEKGSSCLIAPYSIKIKYVKDEPILKIQKEDTQSEIILFKDLLEYNIISQKYIEEEKIMIVKIETKNLNNKKEK